MLRDPLPTLLGVLLGLLMVQSPEAQPLDLARVEAVADSVAQAQLTLGAVPGMTVAVAKEGDILFERGYGQADVEMGVAARPETLYRIASITKQFTAAAVLRLVEAGRMALDDPITRYLPDYPTQGHPLTIRNLLNHTSGIGSHRYTEPEARREAQRQTLLDLTAEEMLGLFADAPFAFEPGQEFAYGNQGYILLGMIIGEVTGVPYAEYVERELLRPLGLDHTHYCDVRRILPDRAEGYVSREGELANAPYISMQNPGGAGALCSTVGDLTRWTHLLHGGQVVSPASLEQMTAPTVLATGDAVGYGYGLWLDELGGHPMVFHGGSISGFRASLLHFPDDDLTVTVLMNSGTGDDEGVAKALARAALGVEILNLPLRAEDLPRYEGVYAVQVGENRVPLRVFGEDGRLHAEVVGQDVVPLLYQGDDVFVAAPLPDIRLVFTVEGGRAERVAFHVRDQVHVGAREP